MAFPTSPTNGATATVNSITYTYDSTNNAWTRVPVLFTDLTVTGNLNVLGTETTFDVNNLVVSDSLIYLSNSTGGADLVDIGVVGHFVGPGYQHTGLVRDATDKTYKLFEGVSTEPSGSTLDFTSAIYSSFMVGNIVSTAEYAKSTFNSLSTANALVTGGSITGITGSASTLQATNFSTGNAQITTASITGGSITGVTGSSPTFTIANLSSANAIITGGSVTSVTGSATTLVATNFSTGNAVVSGGSVTGINGAAVTFTATNFTAGNCHITGADSSIGVTHAGAVSAIANVYATTGQFTNLSSGNAIITGGSILLSGSAGTTPPLKLTSGTLTTATAGSVEYDGRIFYKTTQGTERGVSPAAQMYVLNANRGLATAVTTQTLFNQTFKVTANTRYYYEAFISISKANATANTLQYALVLGGTPAVLAAHEYSVMSKWAAARTTVTAMSEMSNYITTGFNTLVSVSAASAAAAATVDARIQGYIDVTTGGTIDPQIALATNATTTPLLLAHSYWKMFPVGPISANTSVQ